MKFNVLVLGLAAAVASFTAAAAQKDITVTAVVDPNIDLYQADGSPLPAAIAMSYLPGTGLSNYVINTKIVSNDVDADVEIKLVSAAQLINAFQPSVTVPLTVRYNNSPLTSTAPLKLEAADIFPGGSGPDSIAMPLTIAQTAVGELAQGTYNGVISVLVTQAP